MDINLEEIGQMVVIAGAVGAGIKYVIIRPLQNAIESLDLTIAAFGAQLEAQRQDQHGIDKRLVKAEAGLKSAHHRIDGLEEAIHR